MAWRMANPSETVSSSHRHPRPQTPPPAVVQWPSPREGKSRTLHPHPKTTTGRHSPWARRMVAHGSGVQSGPRQTKAMSPPPSPEAAMAEIMAGARANV